MRWVVLLGVCGLASCGSPKVLEIRQYQLREVNGETGGIDSIRAEQLMRLHGAVSLEAQRERLGHYYTVRWDGPEGLESEPVRLVFRFRQAATGSAVRRMELDGPPGRKGAVEFQVVGRPYLEGGRVLAWHLGFYRGGKLVATRQSYLWE